MHGFMGQKATSPGQRPMAGAMHGMALPVGKAVAFGQGRGAVL